MKLLDQVLGKVDLSETCGGQANLEPLLPQARWNMAHFTFTQAVTHTRMMGVVLAVSQAFESASRVKRLIYTAISDDKF